MRPLGQSVHAVKSVGCLTGPVLPFVGLTWLKSSPACCAIPTDHGFDSDRTLLTADSREPHLGCHVAALYAASRILVAICRERLLPPVVAWVWDRTLTPVWCTLITGLICCAPATSPRPLADGSRTDRCLYQHKFCCCHKAQPLRSTPSLMSSRTCVWCSLTTYAQWPLLPRHKS